MRVFRSIDAAKGALAGASVTIGNFDGVHLGHQALVQKARALAAPRNAEVVALTFDPHPAKVLSPSMAPPLMTSPARKVALLADAGATAVVLQPFDRTFAQTTAEDFALRDLAGSLGAAHVVVGHDFTFGKGRSGHPARLATLLEGRAEVHVVPPVTADDLVVSSSKIRELLLTGRVAAAARLLGRPFLLDGTVVRGQGRGRTIGIPTANVAPAAELIPAAGVYAVQVASRKLPGVVGGAANIGVKPTFGGTTVTVEVHLFDVSVDLYGEELAVAFLERLRGEQKFPDAGALVAQVRQDLASARALAAAPPPEALRVPPPLP